MLLIRFLKKMSYVRTLYLLSIYICSVLCQNYLWFQDQQYVTEEIDYIQVDVVVRRNGSVGVSLTVFCQLEISAQDEFQTLKVDARFSAQSPVAICEFYIKDDNKPEANETYAVTLLPSTNHTILPLTKTFITILPNDDPYGCIGFTNQQKYINVKEPKAVKQPITFSVKRYGGRIGDISSYWMVSPIQNKLQDIDPGDGYLSFFENEETKDFQVYILLDEIPELLESYMIRLRNVSGGACIWSNASEIEIRIEENDAPVRFKSREMTFTEPDKKQVEVLRGFDNLGNRVGPIMGSADVHYRTVAGSAQPDIDYIHQEGIITFGNSSTLKSIEIEILSDPKPELTETFSIELTSVSDNVILSEPHVMVIKIQKNDHPHGLVLFSDNSKKYILYEDDTGEVHVPVNRSHGTFGNISVTWKLETKQSHGNIFKETSGVIYFLSNETTKMVPIRTVDNQVPSEAMEIDLILLNTTGGAVLALENDNKLPNVKIIIADSDNAYGTVSLTNQQANIIFSATPRRIESRITRSGGTLADVTIAYTVQYFYPSSRNAIPNVLFQDYDEVILRKNEREVVVVLEIRNDAFLKTDSEFVITLKNVSLTKTTLIPPTSPLLGALKDKTVKITQDLANGEIGFFNTPVAITVKEPKAVSLMLMRDGTSNQANVFWRITSENKYFNENDVKPLYGFVMFEKGIQSVNISFVVQSDHIPELDETFVVELYNSSDRNEKLRQDAEKGTSQDVDVKNQERGTSQDVDVKNQTKAYVTIERNDEPGGIFEFNNTSNVALQVKYDTLEAEFESKEISIVRHGGSLERQLVKININKGANDFQVVEKILSFPAGITQKYFMLYPIDDDIPEYVFAVERDMFQKSFAPREVRGEARISSNCGLSQEKSLSKDVNVKVQLSETFTVTLQSVSGSKLGNLTSFNVTITESDYPYGLVSFSNDVSNINQKIVESYDKENEVKFQFSRNKGRHGNIFISWRIVSAQNDTEASDDVYPTSGVVEIEEGQNTNILTLKIKQDKIPEEAEIFDLTITNITGGAVVTEPSKAQLTISANDFPVMLSPSLIRINEGDHATLFIKLYKPSTEVVTVTIETSNVNKATSFDYQSINETVRFEVGETEKQLTVYTKQDDLPEIDESFRVSITSTTGDTILWKNYTTLVVINGNDDANGVFQFQDVTTREVEEGDKITLRVSRLRGLYGAVNVTWSVLHNNSKQLVANSTVSKTNGVITYEESQNVGFIEFNVIEDGVPELMENLTVILTNISAPLARFGKQDQVTLLVLSNDHPNGVFMVDASKTTQLLVEDRGTETKDVDSNATITIKREKGSFFAAKVIWEISLNTSLSTLTTWDLLLRSDLHNGSVVEGRMHATTPAYYFASGSCALVSSDNQPPAIDLENGFTYTVWMKTNSKMRNTILKKGSVALTDFEILVDGTKQTLEISVDNDVKIEIIASNLTDHQWHSIIISISLPSTIQVYIDGQKVSSSDVSSLSSVYTIPSNISIGCNSNITLKDLRIYTQTFDEKLVNDFMKLNNKAFTITNGLMYFLPGETEHSVSIATIDNNTPEPNMAYKVAILDVFDETTTTRDHAVISEQQGALDIVVLKSDFANGIFSIDSSTCPNNITETSSYAWNVTVVREHGLFSRVAVAWELRNSTGSLATNEFLLSHGKINFMEEEKKQVIELNPKDDMIPEQRESFTLSLVSYEVHDNTDINITTNDAKLNKSKSSCAVEILQNDNPYGLFQVMDSIPVKTTHILPLHRALDIRVLEEQGFVDVYIVRAQGTLGTVQVEWKTEGGSAIGGSDYKESVGSVTFKPGQLSAKLKINIKDNSIPELTKTFKVVLRNPTGGAKIGKASSMTINIRPSDNAMGVFSLLETNITALEGESINFTVYRTGGTLGDVGVTWVILNGTYSADDFVYSFGQVQMKRQERIARFSLQVKDDSIPELTETFEIIIANLSDGNINKSADTAKVTIPANDDPYGLFRIQQKHYTVAEDSSELRITVERYKGLYGDIRVFFQVLNGSVILNEDFSIPFNFIDFEAGMNESDALIQIIDDNIPEIDETFHIVLSETYLVQPTGTTTPLNDLIDYKRNNATITINQNDNANGVIEFQTSLVNITEDFTGPFVNVSRNYGLFGRVSFEFSVESITALLGSDIQVNTFRVTLADGQSSILLPVYVIDDNVPEFDEAFIVRILPDTIQGGAVAGARLSCEYVILENDYPYGLIGFTSPHQHITIREPESSTSSRLTLTIKRQYGLVGTVQVFWQLKPHNLLSNFNDIHPLQGSVGFLTGENQQTVTLNVLADNIPEFNETYSLQLASIQQGNAVIDAKNSIALVTILPNDNPYGTVSFLTSSLNVSEESSKTIVNLKVQRSGGYFGDLKVHYRTVEIQMIDSNHKADGNNDYTAVLNGSFIMKNNTSSASISLEILNDTFPELYEEFQVKLTDIELLHLPHDTNNQPTLGLDDVMTVRILENDFPYGRLRLSLDVVGYSNIETTSVTVDESDSSNVPLQFSINRFDGSFNQISVSWRLSPDMTITPSLDISGSSGAAITFEENEKRKTFTITVNYDNIPELDEYFNIELYNPTNGAVLDSLHQSIKVIINANDQAGGVIGFRQGSRSVTAQEGTTIRLFLERTRSFFHTVTVEWRIRGNNASSDFLATHGFVTFVENQQLAELQIQVKSDLHPEPDEDFKVDLISINTTGLHGDAAAILNPTTKQAHVLLGASNDPHGVFEFVSIQQPLRIKEDLAQLQLTVIRKQGKIGLVELFYDVQPIQNGSSALIPNDVHSNNPSIVIPDGADSIQIPLIIVNDEIPEIDESFRVILKSVVLRSTSTNSSVLPMLGNITSMLVTIEANDGAHGELLFDTNSLNPTINEDTGTFNLTIHRTLGVFGDVYCFYFLNRLTASLNDFYVNGGVMQGGPAKSEFQDGQREANISITIHNDDITEDMEQFEIGLTIQNAVNNGGVVIGQPSRTVISILPNDDASGIFEFREDSRHVILSEPNDMVTGRNSFDFFVVRKAGWFGYVVIQWQIVNNTNYDVTPLNGMLSFNPYDREESFQIKVIDDDLPETERLLGIKLDIQSGNAKLGQHSMATVLLTASDYPNGIFTFKNHPTVYTEESQSYKKITVVRMGGSVGDVSVAYHTQPKTATTEPATVTTTTIVGTEIMLDVNFVFDDSDVNTMYSVASGMDDYIFVVRMKQVDLYVWRGTFLKLKSFIIPSMKFISSVTIANNIYILLGNTQSIGIYHFHDIYNTKKNKSLTLIQTIQLFNHVSDARVFSADDQHYLAIVIGQDDQGDSIQTLQLYKWNGNTFLQHQSYIQTYSGIVLDTTGYMSSTYLLLGNRYNRITNTTRTKSFIYQYSTLQQRFLLYGEITTNNVGEMKFLIVGKELFVGVVNRESCVIYKHERSVTVKFVLLQDFGFVCQSIGLIEDRNEAYLVVAVSTFTYIFQYSKTQNRFIQLKLLPLESVRTFKSVSLQSTHYIGAMLDDSAVFFNFKFANPDADYGERAGILVFDSQVSELDLFLTIYDDHQPETDENFNIMLSNSTNGAMISSKSSLEVVIIANDNAYGRIEFANSSLHLFVIEEESEHNTAFQLQVQRLFGSFGNLDVYFDVNRTPNRDNLQNEIYPSSGQIRFESDERLKEIVLYVRSDPVPELIEHFDVSLTRVVTENRELNGATINPSKNKARVAILPNDNPYGIFSWKSSIQVTTELTEINSTVLLVIQRTKGSYGDVLVFYETSESDDVGLMERKARPYVDYIPASGNISVEEGETEKMVFINITHKEMEKKFSLVKDGMSDTNEIFQVNLKSVELLSNSTMSHVSPPIINSMKNTTQVIITEIVQSHGVVEFNTSDSLTIDENVGTLSIPVVRKFGFEGLVGVYFMIEYTTASPHDISTMKRTMIFETNQTLSNLSINIVNDENAELMEQFTIILTKPVGGVTIGVKNQIQINIKENDYPYGLFSIPTDSNHIITSEGYSVKLPIERLQGSRGQVAVMWQCDGHVRDDITKTSGIEIYEQGEVLKYIQFDIINDNLPEVAESFQCQLMNATNGGSLSNHTTAQITINASDKPFGVFQLQDNQREIYTEEGSNFTVRVLRDVGNQGPVSISWHIECESNDFNNTKTTFTQINGILFFNHEERIKDIQLKVLLDNKPEESQLYYFSLHTPTGGAELATNPSATRSNITVAASGNPYGVFKFDSTPSFLSVSETIGNVNLVVKRTRGLIGTVVLKYQVFSVNATPGLDYSPTHGELTFNENIQFQSFNTEIINDSLPELNEQFTVRLQSVTLLNKTFDYNITKNGIQLNVPPLIDPASSTVHISIEENDEAYGVIGFRSEVLIVHEWQGHVNVPIIRQGGLFESSTVQFTYISLTATQGIDYIITNQTLTFLENQNQSNLVIQLIDDVIPEGKETFEIHLLSVRGKAKLGKFTKLTVTIETSDNPHGLFGFYNVSDVFIQNPVTTRRLSIPITRLAGNKGAIQVDWELTRQETSTSLVTEDITPMKGSITFLDTQDGQMNITISVLPYGGPTEKEESFLLKLININGGATIDDSSSTVSLTIGKKGYPSGLFYLLSNIQPSNNINEPQQNDVVELQLTVGRRFGRMGNVQVSWSVQSSTGNIFTDLQYNPSQKINFIDDQSTSHIKINITSDDEPEIDETFTVVLTTVTGSAEIDETQNSVTFTILANDNPYGVFYLPTTGQNFQLNPNTLKRSLEITAARQAGLLGDVKAMISVDYLQQPTSSHEIYFTSNQATSSIVVPISEEVFLETASSFTVRLTRVSLLNETTSSPPVLSNPQLQGFIEIPENAANSVIQLTNSSLYVPADLTTNRAIITIERSGLFGSVTIPWSSGYPAGMMSNSQFSIGSMNPSSGSVSIPHNQRLANIEVTINIPSNVDQALHYVIHLNNNLLPTRKSLGWSKLGVNKHSIVEVHGVIRFASASRKVTVLEGQVAELTVERIYTTIGSIRVSYKTKLSSSSNPALPDKDYVPMTSSIDFNSGEYRKTIRVQTLDDVDNPQPENLEIFQLQLTDVSVLTAPLSTTSPRLSTLSTAEISIQDNDDPYGVISFKENSRRVSIDESTQILTLNIERFGGSYSTASLKVLTVGGGESWSNEIVTSLPSTSSVRKAIESRKNNALAYTDYEPVNTVYTFPDGSTLASQNQQISISIKILQDTTAEPAEEFFVLIMNATGGAKIFEPHSYSVVKINANGLYNGEVGFKAKRGSLDEDGVDSFVDLIVERAGQALQEITVSWVATSEVVQDLLTQIQPISGTVTLIPGVASQSFRISSIQDNKAEFASWFKVTLTAVSTGANIKQSESLMNITLKESDYPNGKIGFFSDSRYVVKEPDSKIVSLIVRRTHGTLQRVTVRVQTEVNTGNSVDENGIKLNAAVAGKDFTSLDDVLVFEANETEQVISIKIFENTETSAYPKVFHVVLSEPSNGAVVDSSYMRSHITLSIAGVTHKFLKYQSSILNLPIDDDKIERVLRNMLSTIQTSSLANEDQQLIKVTIKDILNFKSSQPSGQQVITSQSKEILLNIYNELMTPTRSDTNGKSDWMKSLEMTSYALLNDLKCPSTVTYVKSNFDVTVQRSNRTSINGLSFVTGDDYFRYPVNLFALEDSSTCSDVHFVNLKNRHWFGGNKVVLNDKVLSSALNNIDMQDKKVVYRIHAPDNRITPSGISCAIWEYPSTSDSTGSWSTSSCQVYSKTKTYVECQCNHLSEYAVLAGSDDRSGYELYFFIACYITIGACFLAIFAHHCCALERTYTSKLIMHIFFAIMITNILFVVAAYISPDLLSKPTECGILGIFIHYFFLAQFTNIFVQSWNLWRILVMNDEHSDRKAVPFFLLGWGLPVIVIAGYVFITHAAFDWNFEMMYADVHGNGDLCFISHDYAAFCSVVIPALLLLLACLVVFIQAYQVTPQWKYYDDVFRGRYNSKEVRHLMILFTLVTLTWVFAGLHITYGSLWMLIVFTVFNVLVGLYIFIVYFILRNQMRNTFKGSYHVEQPSLERVELPHMIYEQVDSLKRPMKTNQVDLNEWSDVNMSRLSPHPHMHLRSVTPLSINKHVYTTPNAQHRHANNNAYDSRYGNNNVSYDDDEEENIDEDVSADFDDLILALKTGDGYSHSPSFHEETIANENPDLPPASSASEQYAVRRIKMADTHL